MAIFQATTPLPTDYRRERKDDSCLWGRCERATHVT
jgi:hypothetical protein